jgi:Flp pilus assembly protein TadG
MRRNQAGQVLVSTALGLVVLLGISGLAVDMGAMRYQRRLQQTAADGAAIAGALDLSFGSGVVAGAQNRSSQNGFTDNNSGAGCVGGAVGCISIAVNNGPTIGPHAGDAKYVEVIVTEIQPTYFMKIFGVNSKPVVARAVATNVSGGTNTSCLWTLGPPTSSIVGIDPTGSSVLNGPNCGISDNGNMDTTGNAYTVIASTVSVSGSCIGSHCGSPDIQCTSYASGTCPTLGSAPASGDPLSTLTPPSQPAYSASCPAVPPAGFCDYSSAAKSTATIQPGTYNSISIGSNSDLTMASGIYYINGPITIGKSSSGSGFNFGGKGSVTSAAGGVMLYFTNGSTMGAVGGGNIPDVQLTAITTGTYAGILVYQNPNDTAGLSLGGDNNSTFNGTVYAPTATLTFFGNNNVNFNGPVIASSLQLTGNPTVNLSYSTPGVPIPALLTQPVLVE